MAKWVMVKENQRGKEVLTIRRSTQVNGKVKIERLPIRKYRHFRDNPEEIRAYLLRINEAARERVEIKHAFINADLLDEYRKLLCTQKANKISANCEYQYVYKYFLQFFIGTENILDPVNWHKYEKTKWADFLLSDKAPKSMSTKKQIVHAVNKFMKWLHKQRPTEVPLMKFEPFELARIQQIEYDEEKRKTYLMVEKDFKLLLGVIDKSVIPIVMLCYHFGLRRSEAMGLSIEHVRKGHLLIDRQLLKVGVYGPPKGREARKVVYWGTTPLETFQWVQALPTMHPRTFAAYWDEAVDTLIKKNKITLPYNPHDLRHTWITRMIRLHAPRDVQMAAGHKDINTTMAYLKDDRDLSNEPFSPKAS